MLRRAGALAAWAGGLLLAGCAPAVPVPAPEPAVQRRIELSGPAGLSTAEISGMAWRGSDLWLLPQCPGALAAPVPCSAYVLPESALRAYLAAPDPAPLAPAEVPVEWPALQGRVEGSQGFEAVAFAGERVYVTLEARKGSRMQGYLASGRVTEGPRLLLEAVTPVPLPAEAECDRPGSWACNKSMEALLAAGDRLLVFFEVNSRRFVREPVARVFDAELRPLGALPVEPLEYRLTDASEPDGAGRFWVSNYHFPSDRLCAGTPCTEVIERLVEMRATPAGVRRTETPPVEIAGVQPVGRNWEGIVRLGSAGVLVVTDDFPRPTTILCFVPLRGGGEPPEDRCR